MQGRGVQRHEHLVRVQQLPQGGAQVVALEGVVARQVHHVCLQLPDVRKGMVTDPLVIILAKHVRPAEHLLHHAVRPVAGRYARTLRRVCTTRSLENECSLIHLLRHAVWQHVGRCHGKEQAAILLLGVRPAPVVVEVSPVGHRGLVPRDQKCASGSRHVRAGEGGHVEINGPHCSTAQLEVQEHRREQGPAGGTPWPALAGAN
eukprot:1186468-Prorocentrum_minimum.AAC.2